MPSSTTLLSLLNLPRYGRKTVLRIMVYFSDEIQDAGELINAISRIPSSVKRLKIPSKDQAESAIDKSHRIVTESHASGVHVIGFSDENYPSRLRTIPDPPPVLFAKGDISIMSAGTLVALIGTRTPSNFGRKSAFAIGKKLAEFGSVVVSGLALGCDTQGHKGCLEGNGVTIAVLAHGLHTVSPASNRPLAQQILEHGGCLVSEYAIGVDARRNFFVERDRLQSGLSDAVIVAETGIEGGSMHTVRFCEEQGRKLACVKHPAHNPHAEGNEMLIASNRAVALSNKNDVEMLVRELDGTRQKVDVIEKNNETIKPSQMDLF